MPAVRACATPKGVVALWHSASAQCHWHSDGTHMALAPPATGCRNLLDGRRSTSVGTEGTYDGVRTLRVRSRRSRRPWIVTSAPLRSASGHCQDT